MKVYKQYDVPVLMECNIELGKLMEQLETLRNVLNRRKELEAIFMASTTGVPPPTPAHVVLHQLAQFVQDCTTEEEQLLSSSSADNFKKISDMLRSSGWLAD